MPKITIRFEDDGGNSVEITETDPTDTAGRLLSRCLFRLASAHSHPAFERAASAVAEIFRVSR